ncbi:IclR family transcriptional regulator [Plantactinospora sp. KLBMP9567]|uniref:IclR family transcriptional regulator n=1 Tax=Plantactinospora sp. KLBMP9567 TaxID=3085900 RepID=UPI002982B20E|nr:IclR family transcriptional regulator [Plantactinospora sp. KLBMP9567]MDW5325026.1 IclR family transcriptional regulator [Plantactinospora sp. KLBMP9567]
MKMANNERKPDGLRAVERTVAVLRALAESPPGASLTELVKATEIPATTLHRMLGVLRGTALVRETADGRYALAAGTMTLARSYLDGLDLRQEALGVMRPLSAQTGETCHLGVLALVHVVYIEKVDSPSPVRMYSRVGQTNPALTTAIGRAILAHSPAHVLDGVIEAHGRLSGEPVVRVDIDALLAGVRADGYARDLQESELGICCVAAPVFDHAGHVVAGLGISAPATRFDAGAAGRLGPQVRAAAADLSGRLGWSGPSTRAVTDPQAGSSARDGADPHAGSSARAVTDPQAGSGGRTPEPRSLPAAARSIPTATR